MVMAVSMAVSVFAENIDVYEYDTGINITTDVSLDEREAASARDINVPTALHNLSSSDYTGSFYPIYKDRYTYTLKKFSTNTGKITINLVLGLMLILLLIVN